MADLSFDDLIPQQPSGGSKELDFGDLVPKAAPAKAERVPVYDPLGGVTGYTEEALQPSKMPYGEQMANVGAAARTFARGAGEGFLGQVGDVALAARRYDPFTLAGLMPKIPVEERPFGRELGIFPAPTTEEVAKGTDILFGEPEEGKAGFRTAGQVVGPFVPTSLMGKTARAIGETAIGRPSIRGAKVAESAEAEGLTVKASQPREREPLGQPLSLVEQKKANLEVSKATGAETNSITPEFVKQRLDKLGEEYNRIYDRKFDIDEAIAQAAKIIAEQERGLGAAGDAGVASIASNIAGRFDAAQQAAKQQQIMQIIKGQQTAMKRGKGEFVERKFGPGERIDAAPLTDDLLRSYGAADHTNVRPITAADSPEWASDVNKLITELTDKLGLRVRPGVYVGNGAGSYGWAHPYGHIFLNERLLPKSKDAVATALHEFGHMVEFQLFEQAPKEVKTAIAQAWAESKAAGKGKTVEQLRPITSEKYGPEHAKLVPQTARDKEYYLGFKEWYAEQVSRWLTTQKEPVTIAEKFFKGIADAWKAIYAKITGHLPMAKATDDFMRLNFDGKLINENTVQRVFQLPEGKTVAAPAAPAPSIAKEAVTASVEGKDLQRLRSYISDRAANHPDGNVRFQARKLLNEIDGAIEKTNSNIAKQLKDVNSKYRATLTLRELQKAGDPSLDAGNISPQTLGRLIQSEGAELSHPLSKYGQYGNVLRMRSSTQGPETEPDVIRSLLSRGGRVVRFLGGPLTPLYESAQRRFQRRMTPGAPPPTRPEYVTPAAGLPARVLPQEEQ